MGLKGGVNPVPVPSLDELAAHPERVQELPPAVTLGLLTRVAGLEAALLVQSLAGGARHGGQPDAQDGDRLLTAKEAANTLACSIDWLYRHAAKLPFTVRLGRALRFSAEGLDRYVRQRQGRTA
jgi:predicted DNA-binding transcriptional regulator AlpA